MISYTILQPPPGILGPEVFLKKLIGLTVMATQQGEKIIVKMSDIAKAFQKKGDISAAEFYAKGGPDMEAKFPS